MLGSGLVIHAITGIFYALLKWPFGPFSGFLSAITGLVFGFVIEWRTARGHSADIEVMSQVGGSLDEANIELLDAEIILRNKIVNTNGALTNDDWVPDRSHIEGMAQAMSEAVSNISNARAVFSAKNTK